MARRRRWSEEQMRELVQEHERSGVSLKAFAAAAGVPYTTLAWWRARLRGGAEARLVPVVVAQDELAGIEIAVGDVVVRVPRGTSAEATARLVRALAAC
ncbi:MAG TPA: transposase [Phycisphaerales bacterium]|nr:transposase [Phycisphaerales bacterium]